jgi:hypothetical protein
MKKLLPLLALIFACTAPAAEPIPDVLKPYEGKVEKWEKDIQAFERLDTKMHYEKDAVLFMGSSSIRLWSTIAEDVAPYPVIQRGYGGAKFSDVAWYAERIVHPHDFRAVAIFVANDVSGKADDKSPEEVMALVKHVIDVVRARNADAPIFFIAITPTSSRWKVWDKTSGVNDAIEAHCATSDTLHFIPTADAYIGADGKPKDELFRDDRLHLNRDGYVQWGGIIRKALDGVLKK